MLGTHQQLRPLGAFDEMRAAKWMARRLRFADSGSAAVALARFLATGCAGLAVDAAAYSALQSWVDVPAVSRIFSLLFATSVTWQLNRHFTFKAAGRDRAAQAMRYTMVAAISQSVSYMIFLLVLSAVPAIPDLFALLIGAVLGAALGFSGQSIFGFRDRVLLVAGQRIEQ